MMMVVVGRRRNNCRHVSDETKGVMTERMEKKNRKRKKNQRKGIVERCESRLKFYWFEFRFSRRIFSLVFFTLFAPYLNNRVLVPVASWHDVSLSSDRKM